MMAAGPAALGDPAIRLLLAPLIEKAAFVETTNLAWMLTAALSATALAFLPFARAGRPLETRPTAGQSEQGAEIVRVAE